MFQTNSLRFRVALFYAIFGAGLSILLAAGAYLTVEHIGHQLMDEALREELNKHASESIFVEPNTVSIKGYVLSDTMRSRNIPYEIESLAPGSYNMTVGNIDYRVLVVDKYGARYFMMFDTQLQHFQEAEYFRYVETLCPVHDRQLGRRGVLAGKPRHLIGHPTGQTGRAGRAGRYRSVPGSSRPATTKWGNWRGLSIAISAACGNSSNGRITSRRM